MLIVLLALAIFVTLCDAHCKYSPLEVTVGVPTEGCQDEEGKINKFNTHWKSNCVHCVCCERIGLVFCDMIWRPRICDRNKCKEIFNKEKCTYIAIKKNDPFEVCEVAYYMG